MGNKLGQDRNRLKERIFSIQNEKEFNALALDIFQFQSESNPVYRAYLKLLGVHPEKVLSVNEIPCLPVEFFRTHKVYCGAKGFELLFESSSTSGQVPGKHFVREAELYRQSFLKAFRRFYCDEKDYCLLALLPSYLERGNSSLVYMMNEMIKSGGNEQSGFYLDNYSELYKVLKNQAAIGQKTLLIGVSFALLDFVKTFQLGFPELIVMETGGMKGRGEEIIREELHAKLKAGFGVSSIHSEYGMTELLSQSYSKGSGKFQSPPWKKIYIREMNDPFSFTDHGKTGGINIIDLANLDSCSFIETQDLGKVVDHEFFEVLGRFDNSDVRGCNLMFQN